jgi:uncharacterized protein
MLDFQQYQLEFTAHIRNPSAHKKPARVVAERMAVYREAVFNNIFESVSVCFPVCQAAIGKRAWRALLKEFVKTYAAQSPIFREIPQQFLQYLETATPETVKNLPPFLYQLAHYEWVELAVSALETKAVKLSKKMDLLKETPVLAPAHMLLEYDYAVHKISKKHLPKTAEKTFLLVFRNAVNQVKFIELNAMTFQLLQSIQQNHLPGEQALAQLAAALKHPNPDAIIQFGAEILTDLAKQGAIIGSTNAANS